MGCCDKRQVCGGGGGRGGGGGEGGDITHPNAAISKEAGLQSLWLYDSGQLQGWEVKDRQNTTGWSGMNQELWVLHQGTQGDRSLRYRLGPVDRCGMLPRDYHLQLGFTCLLILHRLLYRASKEEV